MGICVSPTISISYFFLAVGKGRWKLPIVIVGDFSITLIPFTWNCFFGKCTVCSLPLIWKVTLLLLQSITAPAVFKKGLPRIIDMLSSSGISSITKSVKIVTLATTTGTSSQIPIGMAVDLSGICKDISVGVSLFKSSLLYKEKGITLTPAPKSHKAVFT